MIESIPGDHRVTVDYFVQQIGSFIVEGKIADLVNTKDSHIAVSTQLAATAFGRLPVQFFQQRGGGAQQDRVARQHGRMTDVLSISVLPRPLRPTRMRLRASAIKSA
jgi:hypothetical protein